MQFKYRSVEQGQLIPHQLDSMTAIYHRKSGITHVVADPVPALLDCLNEQPQSVSDIAEDLSKNYQLEAVKDIEEIVLARLEELVQLGLVDRDPDS